jgi:hypothetical protein
LIVGAHKADTSGKVAPGRSYVDFGKTDNTAIDLSAIASGTGGFVINGESAICTLTVNNKASCANSR